MSRWSHWLPLVALVPVVGGALVPVLFRRHGRAAYAWTVVVAASTTLVAVMLMQRLSVEGPFSYAAGGWLAPYGIELRFDRIAAITIPFSLIAGLAMVFSRAYAERAVDPARVPFYYALLLINLGGVNGFLITGDLFNLFVFVEIFSVSAYALVATARGPVPGLAALQYLLFGAVSSLLVLFAVGVVFAHTGSLNLEDAAGRMDFSKPMPVALALGGFAIGFAVKAALFPVHLWLPDAHAAAPAPVSAILSALVVKTGVVGMLRTFELFAGAEAMLSTLFTLLIWLGALGALGGAVMAFVQRDIKLMLAYSTVTNIGYVFIGLGLANLNAAGGAGVHVVNHAVIKTTLFLAVGAVIHRTGLRDIDDLRGLSRRMPLTAFALAFGLMALAGIPPTAGFVGKWQIALGALEAGRPGLMAVVIIGGVLVLAYGIRVINAMYFRAPASVRVLGADEAPASMWLPVLILAAGCLALGLAGRMTVDFAMMAMRSVYPP